MTVQTTTLRADYVGNAIAITFTVPFYFIDSAHLLVLVGGSAAVLNSDYTVVGAGVAGGGTITFSTAPGVGVDVAILRNVPFTQLTHYVPNDPFPAASHENALDLLTMEAQQLQEQVSRAPVLPSDTLAVSSVPTPTDGTVLGWLNGTWAWVAAAMTGLQALLFDTSNSANGDALIGVKQPFTGAVARTQHDKNRDLVDVADFGAGAFGNTDAQNTAAIQVAVNYCITNSKDLCVDQVYTLTAPINIDQPRDNTSYDAFFTISSSTRGGFRVSSAISMFDSTLAYTGSAPNLVCPAALVRFKDLVFESTDSALAAYVVNPKFMRLASVGCSFSKIKFIATSTVILQSIYFVGCNIRRWSGVWFDSTAINFDVQVHNCLIEAGGDGAFNLAFATGSDFIGTTIEGMTYYAIKYTGPKAFNITDCYFESNGLNQVTGCSVDGASGTGGAGGESITISGCYFSADAGNPTRAAIKWGDNTVANSFGNFCNTRLHNLTATSRINSIGDYAEGSLSNYNANLSGTLLRDSVGTGNVTNPLAEVHTGITSGTKPKHLFTDSGLTNGSGGYVTGYGVTGQGGRVGLGTFQAGVDNGQSVTIDENKAVHTYVTSIDPGRFNNNDMTFQLVSNTSLKIAVQGSDGTSRSVTLTLA